MFYYILLLRYCYIDIAIAIINNQMIYFVVFFSVDIYGVFAPILHCSWYRGVVVPERGGTPCRQIFLSWNGAPVNIV